MDVSCTMLANEKAPQINNTNTPPSNTQTNNIVYSLVQLHIQDEFSSESVDLKTGVGQVADLRRARSQRVLFIL